MNSPPSSPSRPAERTPWYRDPQTRGLVFQITIAGLLAWAIYFLVTTTAANMAERGKIVSLSFLDDVAPFIYSFTPFWDFELGVSQYWEVFVIAIQNTLLVSVLGVIAATLLGFLVGVMRLSPNWLVSKIASVYIEAFRNVPLLLQIFFWNFAVFLPLLPPPRQSWTLGESLVVNKEGLFLPKPTVESEIGTTIYILILIAAVVGIILLARWAKRKQEASGEQFPVFWSSIGILLAAGIFGYFIAGSPMGLEYPELQKFNYTGGLNLYAPLLAMWFSLTTYTAAFIAENVRGGILAISHGQSEAAHALGLRHGITLRLVVIPQAMRVIIPPTISQFLNLTKNSSLAAAIAYEELSAKWMGTVLNQTGQEFLIIASAMAVYLTLSLLTSGVLNWYNKRVQLVER